MHRRSIQPVFRIRSWKKDEGLTNGGADQEKELEHLDQVMQVFRGGFQLVLFGYASRPGGLTSPANDRLSTGNRRGFGLGHFIVSEHRDEMHVGAPLTFLFCT